MGAAARRRATEQFSAERVVGQYVELYERVCDRPASPAA